MSAFYWIRFSNYCNIVSKSEASLKDGVILGQFIWQSKKVAIK